MMYSEGGRGRGRVKMATGGGREPQGKMQRQRSNRQARSTPSKLNSSTRRKVLLLHGNRQTGDVLLGRLEKLKKGLLRELGLELVAPDAPHLFSEDDMDFIDVEDVSDHHSARWQRTWWHRHENSYQGLEESVSMLDRLWNDCNHEFVAIVGFSQGSRLAHMISLIHTLTNGVAFPGLTCVIHFSGYGDCSLPENFYSLMKDNWDQNILPQNIDDIRMGISSLHVMGESDTLVPLKASEALLKWYVQPSVHRHAGNHFVPVKKPDIDLYLMFFNQVRERLSLPEPPLTSIRRDDKAAAEPKPSITDTINSAQPDEEHAQTQIDEVTALAQIFPAEFRLLSVSTPKDPDRYNPDDYFDDNRLYEHPIKYSIVLRPQDDGLERGEEELWPPKIISLGIQYPADYPDSSPLFSLIHDMNYLEFSMQASDALMDAVREAMREESGMPCGMGMVYAARSFFQEGGLAPCTKMTASVEIDETNADERVEKQENQFSKLSVLRPSTASRIKSCNAQGLKVAYAMLDRTQSRDSDTTTTSETTIAAGGKGGTWRYTVGLVGKPSAGKSTFFNAATAFARQRGEGSGAIRCGAGDSDDDSGMVLGGASMGAIPFTTIDPNIGVCLIPAPSGACPEDYQECVSSMNQHDLVLGSSHGRDSKGRRFIPVSLKDVAGLVPGAYQGRGRGNKFLDDLTDADVLVHIVDASGSSDADGNMVCNHGSTDDLSHPLNDLEWVRNELVEWVYSNVSTKWDSVCRRGIKKLVEMFSGYKQSRSFTYDVFIAVESFVKDSEGRDIFEDLAMWDEGDLYRLVSAFLGLRFPMTLALNKEDIPTAAQYIKDIISQLPIHGAHRSVGVSAYNEMKFIRHQLSLAMRTSPLDTLSSQTQSIIHTMNGRVWDCLQSAMSLREPTFVFPVNDLKTYEPLPGMSNYATRDATLPNHGFISCITAAGGSAPSQWSVERKVYITEGKDAKQALRDVILMKPGSTVEHVFLALKGMGALHGEFVRAEAASMIGDKAKPVAKSDVVQRSNRILRIMTTKRSAWQKN